METPENTPERRYLIERAFTPAWLDYARASQYSGLGRTTLWKLVSSGEVKAARVGRAVRINRASLDEALERRVEDVRDSS